MNHTLNRRRALATAMSASLLTIGVVRWSHAGEIEIDGRRFNIQHGFTVERAAGPPLVERPITIDFDERGRLYVGESSGTNDPVDKQLAEKPHRILRLEDTDGDGVFDRRTVFADRMMLPEGTMWYGGSLYVAAPPQIWKLTDTNDDGVADRREVWFDGKTLTGCANDLHGPYLGPDGYIYWCKGAFAEQTYERPGKDPFKTRAAHIFRRKADGTGPIEPVMTGGMDNPVDVAFLANGDRVFTTTFLVHPGGGQRDGIIHAAHGGIYGKVHDPIFDPVHKWTGPDTMPVMVHLGPAAPCGLTRYESQVFGAEFRDNLFACLFNMHKVTRHVLMPEGATYSATTEDFLSSPDIDFHPTDVIEDADGSLLVVNTGGWYKLCCPTSQLHKPDVPGGIYRVRKRDAPPVQDPRGTKIVWDRLSATQLLKLLEDSRPAVRRRAVDRIAALDGDVTVIGEIFRIAGEPQHAELKRELVWAVSRWTNKQLLGREVINLFAADPDPVVRHAALNVLSQRREAMSATALIQMITKFADHFSASDRRLVAETLGRMGEKPFVPPLLSALARSNDPVLDHALTYALIEINAPDLTRDGLRASDANTCRGALVALDQTGHSELLDPQQVAAWMSDDDPDLSRAAAWVVGRHPEWGGALVDVYREKLNNLERPSSREPERLALTAQLAALARSEQIQTLLADSLTAAPSDSAMQVCVLASMKSADLPRLPDTWATALTRFLSHDDLDGVAMRAALAVIRGKKIEGANASALAMALQGLSARADLDDSVRVDAFEALPGEVGSLDTPSFDYLVGVLKSDRELPLRLKAANALAQNSQSESQLSSLAGLLPATGPLELARLLPAFERSSSESVGDALLAALEKAKAADSLRPEQVEPLLAKYPDSIRARARDWLARTRVDVAEQRARLQELASTLPPGDVARGQAVFNGSKAACASCHAIGYLGGKVGPDLTRIGAVRTDQDLLESIVYPSASFVRSYEPMSIATRDGRVLAGLLTKDAPDEITLVIGADKEERIARADIEEIRPATVSVMPAGLDQQLSPGELADLVAFLRACR